MIDEPENAAAEMTGWLTKRVGSPENDEWSIIDRSLQVTCVRPRGGGSVVDDEWRWEGRCDLSSFVEAWKNTYMFFWEPITYMTSNSSKRYLPTYLLTTPHYLLTGLFSFSKFRPHFCLRIYLNDSIYQPNFIPRQTFQTWLFPFQILSLKIPDIQHSMD